MFRPLCLSCRYGKAFEIEPSLHSGINNVVLLMAAGHEFDTSIELRKIGVFVCPLFSFPALVVCTLNSEMDHSLVYISCSALLAIGWYFLYSRLVYRN